MPPVSKQAGNGGPEKHPPPSTQAEYVAPGRNDLINLIALFVSWKTLLLTLVYLSPGPGYDTSTAILASSTIDNGSTTRLTKLVLRLTRWDAIYFATNSSSGYVYEQQWAFSWAATRLSSWLSYVLPLSLPSLIKHSLAGSLIAITTHFGTVVLVYYLAGVVVPSTISRRREIAFTSAALHIISPAGVFLVAPYSESIYAFFSTAGYVTYARAILHRSRDDPWRDSVWTLCAGLTWALATMMRGNGLLNGIVFAWDLLGMVLAFLLGNRSAQQVFRILMTGLAGTFVAAGYAFPQYLAYLEYCRPELSRPWCKDVPPSIYSWVQKHYWDVGFLRYWTVSNVPLFLLAMPMLAILLITGYGALHHSRSILLSINGEERPHLAKSSTYQTQRLLFRHLLERLAVPQLVLAALALTSFHVQIINRISSGYPLWYIAIAIAIHNDSRKLKCGHTRSEHYFPFRHIGGDRTSLVVKGMVVYAIVQAGLYANFLPPA